MFEPAGSERFARESNRPVDTRKSAGRTAQEHDPEKWVPVFRKDHAQIKQIERDDDSKKRHHALALEWKFGNALCGPIFGFPVYRRDDRVPGRRGRRRGWDLVLLQGLARLFAASG